MFSGIESQRKDLLKDIEKLKADIEYEKQPNIAFEKENEALEKQVCSIESLPSQISNLRCAVVAHQKTRVLQKCILLFLIICAE